MTQTTDDTTSARPALKPSEVIRSWLPDHTYVDRPLVDFGGGSYWTWTTPAGLWTVRLGGPIQSWLSLTGPTGEWAFGAISETSLRRLRGVLVALDAINCGDTE